MKSTARNNSDHVLKRGMAVMAFVTLAAAVSLPAYADCEHGHWDKSKRTEFMEKRQNALHDKLGLSASQEPAWSDFVAKSKPGDHIARKDWSELSKLSAPDRLDHMLAMMKEREQAMESRVQVVKTFYAQLTPEQQKIFDESFAHHEREHAKH